MNNLSAEEKFILDLYKGKVNSRSCSSCKQTETWIDDKTLVDCLSLTFTRDTTKKVVYEITKQETWFKFQVIYNNVIVYKTVFYSGFARLLSRIDKEGVDFAEGRVDW